MLSRYFPSQCLRIYNIKPLNSLTCYVCSLSDCFHYYRLRYPSVCPMSDIWYSTTLWRRALKRQQKTTSSVDLNRDERPSSNVSRHTTLHCRRVSCVYIRPRRPRYDSPKPAGPRQRRYRREPAPAHTGTSRCVTVMQMRTSEA